MSQDIQTPTISDAVSGLTLILTSATGEILEAMQRECPGTVQKVTYRDYYDENIDVDMFPILMIQELDERASWYALPVIAEEVFQFSVYGICQHANVQTLTRMKRAFSGALKRALNSRHTGVQVRPGVWMEFTGEGLPVQGINHNVQMGADQTVRGFVASVSVYFHPQVIDDGSFGQ